MCGRFAALANLELLKTLFPGVEFPASLKPHYNIAPSQDILAIGSDEPSHARPFRWGLIPSWAKEESIGNRMINARGESLAEKPSFRKPFKSRRCLIVADGFYEWKKERGGAKTPYYIHLKSNEPFAFAGLWDRWNRPDGSPLESCTIVTTDANDRLREIHDRMPVILPPHAHPSWLDVGKDDTGRLQSLLRPYDADAMETYPVSKLVNSPANDSPECLERERAATDEAPSFF